MGQGLRERKKAETRRALSSAALRLGREHGPEHVTVDDIAHAAGVSPRTFFNYLPSKDDAIAGVVPSESSELLSDTWKPTRWTRAPLDALRAMGLAAAARFEEAADEMWARHDVQDHPALAARRSARFAEVERHLPEVIARRTGLDVDRDVYPALVVAAAIGALDVGVTVWQERGRPGPLAEVIDGAFDQLATGLALRAPAGATSGRERLSVPGGQ